MKMTRKGNDAGSAAIKALAIILVVMLSGLCISLLTYWETPPSYGSPQGSIVSSTKYSNGVFIGFGAFSHNVGVSSFKFILENTSPGNDEGYSSWRAHGNGDGAVLTRDPASAVMPEIMKIYYHDKNGNGYLNIGDGLVMELNFTSEPYLRHYKLTLVYLHTGDVVNFFSFSVDASGLQNDLYIGRVMRNGGDITLIFNESTMIMGMSELKVEVQNITSGSISATSVWLGASNTSGQAFSG
jgi:hypothetical protein